LYINHLYFSLVILYFDVVSDPSAEDAAISMGALMDEHSTRGGWVRQFQMFFRDGFKYNLSAVEVIWDKKVTFDIPTVGYGSTTDNKQLKQTAWEGNCINRWDPYNTFWDARVPITAVSEYGEFAGKVELMSRIAFKQFLSFSV
jgi:hypothetical protein